MEEKERKTRVLILGIQTYLFVYLASFPHAFAGKSKMYTFITCFVVV